MATEFRENPAGIRAMLAAPFLQEALGRIADIGAVAAARNTPVDTGRMRASWRTWHGLKDGRAAAQIFNTARNPHGGYQYPAAIEFGNSRIERQRPLGRAIDDMAAGL